MILGFSGYLIFGESCPTSGSAYLIPHPGLIIGLAYEKITKITPLFIILYVMPVPAGSGISANILFRLKLWTDAIIRESG